ncbi:MAG TPA: arsenic efflux protein [Candidatus Coproplasma stercorigallinarum]|nr:arsenic efflux protein [Candidatus Coproplasma stercorigallinarum]
MWDAILDAFLDTLKIFPFIFVIYVLIELLEHKTSFTRDRERLQGGLAPLIGAATGIIPQCGFSVMAAKLYDRGLIRTGTLLAVFLATSDEALIILLSEGSRADMIVPIIVIKLIVAVGVGYGANFLLADEKLAVMPLSAEDDVHCFSCGREHDGKTDIKVYLVDPLLHSLKIALYLLIVNMVLGCIIYEIGEDAISSLIIGGPYLQPFITAAIGLIPNCASSVIITQTYIDGFMTFGSCVAGLCANAGLGFVVLLKNGKKLKRNLILIAVTYLISVLVGIFINSIALLIN